MISWTTQTRMVGFLRLNRRASCKKMMPPLLFGKLKWRPVESGKQAEWGSSRGILNDSFLILATLSSESPECNPDATQVSSLKRNPIPIPQNQQRITLLRMSPIIKILKKKKKRETLRQNTKEGIISIMRNHLKLTSPGKF